MKKTTHYTVIAKIISVVLLCIANNNEINGVRLNGIFSKTTDIPTETGKTASKTKKWNFEIYNKRNNTIWFSLRDQSDKSLISQMQVGPSGKVRAEVDNSKTLSIKIWTTTDPKKSLLTTTDPDIYKALIANGRTIFLTLDETGIRPQTGTLLGLSGKTDSGLDNTHNINAFSIQGD